MSIRELTTADIANLRIRATVLKDDQLWTELQSMVVKDRQRILRDLENADTPAEKLKFAQGELAQANRDILLVDAFLRALEKEQERRQRAEERQ